MPFNREEKKLAYQLDPNQRRGFIAATATACLGLRYGQQTGFAASANATADHVIYVYLSGGMSHIDTLDPKPGKVTAGEFASLKTRVPGIHISEKLPGLASHMDKIAIIRSMTSKQGAHERGRYLMHTSYNPIPSIQHASLGSWMAHELERKNDSLPANIVVGSGGKSTASGFLGSQYQALTIGDAKAGLQNVKKRVSEEKYEKRLDLMHKLNQSFLDHFEHAPVHAYSNYYEEALRLMNSEDVKAFDINQEKADIREKYGATKIGQGLLLARRLVSSGVRFVEVTMGGYDTHNDNFNQLGEKLPQLDQGLSALLSDLKQTGLLHRTLVVLATEFGRTPKINERNGRDHYPKVFSTMLAGGGIQGGQIYGASDDEGRQVAENAVSPMDFNATIAHAMGVNPKREFNTRIGRPFKLANGGKAIKSLF